MGAVSHTLDVALLRAETPGSSQVNHLNNAGAALQPSVVTDAVIDHIDRESLVGGYEAQSEASDRLSAVYTSIGTLLACDPSQVALVESASEGWSRAFQAIEFTRPFEPGDRILVSASEYASNVLPIMQVAKRTGARLEFIPDDEAGTIDVSAFAAMLDDDVAMVAITHCPSQNGLINDVAGIGAALAGSDAWYVVDGCQSVGQLPVDVTAMRADFFSATGRKWLRGPRGTGFLYASERALTELEPFPLDLHSATWQTDGYEIQPGGRRFEYWEKSYATVLGLAAAVDYALYWGIDLLGNRIAELAARARQGLDAIDGVTVRDRGHRQTGIVTFTHDRVHARDLVTDIRAAGINVSLSTPDYARHDFTKQGVEGLVRVSPHAYNTDDEIDELISTVSAVATGGTA